MAAAGAPAKPRDFPQSHQSQCCAAIRQPRASTRTLDGCRPHDAERPGGIARRATLSSRSLRRSTASFRRAWATVVGSWGCVHVGTVTGQPARIDRWHYLGVANKTTQAGGIVIARGPGACKYYAPGPAEKSTPSAERLTGPTGLAGLPPTPPEKAISTPKLMTVVKKPIVAKNKAAATAVKP